jgi:hypothetical protein
MVPECGDNGWQKIKGQQKCDSAIAGQTNGNETENYDPSSYQKSEHRICSIMARIGLISMNAIYAVSAYSALI